MKKSIRPISAALFFSFLGLLAGDALAQKGKYDPFTLMKSLKKEKKKSGARGSRGPKRLREGAFKLIKKKTVPVSGGAKLQLADIIKANFGDAQKKEGARGAKSPKRRGLYIKPAVEEHAIETKDSFVVARRTTYVVNDPKKHGAKGHRGKTGARGKKRVKKGSFDLKKIPKKRRRFFKKVVIPAIKKLPKSHPFKKAYAKNGMAGVLNAFADGKGDYSVNDEVVVPKGNPVMTDGRVRFTGVFSTSKKGSRGKAARFQTTKKIDWLSNVTKPKSKNIKDKPLKPYSYREEGGELSYTHEFLTGWTWSKHFKKSHHKDYWFLEYKFWAEVGFTIGFRVPVMFEGKMSPAYIRTMSNRETKDTAGKFSVKLSAHVFDANEAYYKSVGWHDKTPQTRGKEFPFHLYVGAGAFVEVCGSKIFNLSIREELDYSHDLQPVYGKNQVLKMKGPGDKKYKNAAFYIPAEITQTVFGKRGGDLWGKAEGLIGAEFGGDGSVSARIKPVINGKTVGKGQTITLSRGETKTAGPFTVPKLSKYGSTSYGYKIDDPKYRWKLKIRPAIKAVVSGECDYFWCGYVGPKTYELGPWYPVGWIPLGNIKLNRHQDTTPSYTVEDGKKQFIKEEIKGESSMYVCLKSHGGQYIHTSSDRLEWAFAQYKSCGLKTTFRMRTMNANGSFSDAPIIHGRLVSLKSALGRYLSIDKSGKFLANKTKPGPDEMFKVSIQGAKKGQALKHGDKIQLFKGMNKPKNKKMAIIAPNGGGGQIVGYKKGWRGSEALFTVVPSKKRNFKWTCKDGKRDGHSNCSVRKMSGLKPLGNACTRDGKGCPCYIDKPKGAKKGYVWCVKELVGRMGKTKYTISGKPRVCWKTAPVRKKANKISLVASTEITYCQLASFRTTDTAASCTAKSVPLKLKNGATTDHMRFRQNHKGCPFWISSKYTQIAARAIPEVK